MDNYMSIFNGILSTDGTYLDIYLDGLEEHKKFSVHNNDEAGLVQRITSLLTTATTRILGLRLLDKFLDNCSNDALEKKGHLWTTLVLKACNNQDLERYAPVIFQVLIKLVKNSQKVPDLAKSFVSAHITKIYDSATNVPLTRTQYALKCIETCLRVYPGSSGPSRGVIERFLWKNIDHIDYEIAQNCGKCLHLLQQVKGGGIQGINHKTQWKNFQLQLLGGIHNVYNAMFTNCSEIYDEKIEQANLPWESELSEFDAEPVKKAAQMYIRCRNLILYLSIALKEPFPVEKPILIKKIINVIVRGMSVNCLMLEGNPIADNIALSVLLPKLHIDLLNLLNIAISILRGHIRPYAELILGLTVDALKWTSTKNANGHEKNLISLRKKVYDTITLWSKLFKSGSLCEVVAEHLFQEILGDITPTQHECTLKVLSGARKHMSKKARKQLHSVHNEKPKISKNQSETGTERQQELCIAALRSLQEVISSVSNFLKPTTLKMMQTSVVKISALFYELRLNPGHLYSNINCRIEIYNTLYAMLMSTHHLCPPPTEFALAIIQTAYTRDESLKVRSHCDFILRNIEKLVHPQKESLLFPVEARDIRNAFIKLGHEHLLNDFEFNATSVINDNIIDEDIVLEVSGSEHSAFEQEKSTQNGNTNEVESEDEITIQKHDSEKVVNVNEDEIAIQELDSEKVVNVKASSNGNQRDITNGMESPVEDITIQVSDNEEITSNISESTIFEKQTKLTTPDLNAGKDKNNDLVINEKEDETGNIISDEPTTKKPKLNDEKNTTDDSAAVIDFEQDDEMLLAAIASQFVDELY